MTTTKTTTRAERLLGAPERRSFKCEDLELRAANDETLTLTGYASVFETPFDMYGGPEKGGWVEIVDRHAFDVTLRNKPDVHLLINHDGMPLARTKSGTLALSTDRVGLKVEADLDRRDPDVQSLEVKMGRGDMDEMSFAFRTIRHEWNEEQSERRMLELNLDKGDVSVVNFGANPATSSKLRGLVASLAEIDLTDEMFTEARALGATDIEAARANLTSLLRSVTTARTLTLKEAEALINGY